MIEQQPDWMRDALCLGMADRSHDPWHPDDPTLAERNETYAQARRVCQRCPVRLPCAQLGMEMLARDQAKGMFGGLRPDEMRRIARELEMPTRKQARHGSRSRYVAGCRCSHCRTAHAAYEHARRIGAVKTQRDAA